MAEARFVAWFTGGGGWLSPSVALRDYAAEGAGRGMAATAAIAKGEVLFRIPRRLLLSAKTTAHRGAVLQHASKAGWSRIMWSVVLERLAGADSFWQPYLDIVPPACSLPIGWSAADRAFLAGTGVPERIGEPAEDFRRGFLRVARRMPASAALPEDALRELYFGAGALVSAYSFTEEDGTITMVPMADMLNHRTGHNNARLFFEADELHMVAVRAVAAGEQLFNTYGDLGNTELLFRYGYLDDPNPFSGVEVRLAEFLAFAATHTCAAHSAAQCRPAAVERLAARGALEEVAVLPRTPQACAALLGWLHRAYGLPAATLGACMHGYRQCAAELLQQVLQRYPADAPQNDRQRLAARLAAEQRQILAAYLALLAPGGGP